MTTRVTIAEACSLVTDGTHYTPVDIGTGYPFLTVKDVSDEGLDLGGCSRISEQDFMAADSGNSAPREGDVLFSKDGTVGKVHVVKTNQRFAVLSSLAILRPKSGVDSEYLGHVLRFPMVLEDALKRKTGSAIRRIILSDLKQVRIPLPAIEEQRRIAAILVKAEELRAKRSEALTLLDRFAQSIFVKMFGDPATNPKKWRTSLLGNICVVGSSKRVFVEELVGEGIPFYRGTEIGQLGDSEPVKPSLFISPAHYERLRAEAGVPSKGDLLLPSICPDGRIYIVDTDDPFYFKDARVLWIKVDQSQINSTFLKHYLKLLFSRNYSKIASGTTFAELKIFALKSLDIQLPPMDLQLQFANSVSAADSQIVTAKKSQENLVKLFQTLQSLAFSGAL